MLRNIMKNFSIAPGSFPLFFILSSSDLCAWYKKFLNNSLQTGPLLGVSRMTLTKFYEDTDPVILVCKFVNFKKNGQNFRYFMRNYWECMN